MNPLKEKSAMDALNMLSHFPMETPGEESATDAIAVLMGAYASAIMRAEEAGLIAVRDELATSSDRLMAELARIVSGKAERKAYEKPALRILGAEEGRRLLGRCKP